MPPDVYERGIVSGNAFAARTAVTGSLVAILDATATGRALTLIAPLSRAVLRHDIHELLATSEPAAGPGQTVNAVSYLGFFAVEDGGIILAGDRVRIGDREVGQVAGFDLSHFPNHMNIVLRASALTTGKALGLTLRERVSFSSGSAC